MNPLPALFIALLMIGQRSLPYFVSAVFGAGTSLLADIHHMGNIGIVVGALIGATCGMYLKRLTTNVHGRKTQSEN